MVGKIYALVLEARIRGVVESKGALSDSQYGFRADRSTVDAVFVLTETAKRFGSIHRLPGSGKGLPLGVVGRSMVQTEKHGSRGEDVEGSQGFLSKV